MMSQCKFDIDHVRDGQSRGLFNKHGLSRISTDISNYILYKILDKLLIHSQNFIDGTVETGMIT